MTIGITGPRRRAPWRGAVVVLIIAAIVLSICLILLGLTGDFLVDWLWFSTIGYLYRIPEIVTLGRFPDAGESDSRWRTKEVRHVGSDTLTPGF